MFNLNIKIRYNMRTNAFKWNHTKIVYVQLSE